MTKFIKVTTQTITGHSDFLISVYVNVSQIICIHNFKGKHQPIIGGNSCIEFLNGGFKSYLEIMETAEEVLEMIN